jgi:catechol 2,3-dioxygenase
MTAERFEARFKDSVPATPGSFGESPAGFRLPAGTAPGTVTLQVGDLERSLDFYRSALGLVELENEGGRALVGTPAHPLLDLRERQGARAVPRRLRFGLFHFALLLPDRAALGRFAKRLVEVGVPFGAGDHLVSESFYLSDPDGLGIEVYADRSREGWLRVGRELLMGTDPVDVEALVAAAGSGAYGDMPAGTVMGHAHLHVGDLRTAATFYSEALGFDRMVWSYPGALFFAAGDYHHHLGTNIWAGASARPPADNEAQLLEWSLDLPDEAALAGATASLAAAGFAAEVNATRDSVRTRDPWGTALRLEVRSPGPRSGSASRPER